MFDTKKEFKSALIGFLGFTVIFNLIFWFKADLIDIILLLIAYTMIKALFLKSKTKAIINNIISVCIITPIAYYIIKLYGFMGFSIVILFLLAVILYSKRKKYIEAKEHIESMIWGKPLMEFKRNKEELPKLKFKL